MGQKLNYNTSYLIHVRSLKILIAQLRKAREFFAQELWCLQKAEIHQSYALGVSITIITLHSSSHCLFLPSSLLSTPPTCDHPCGFELE